MSESYTDCFFKEHSSCQWYWHGMVCVSALNCWLNTFSVFSTLQFWDYFNFICVEEKRNVRDHVCFLYPIIAGSYRTHVWKKVMRHETALFSHHEKTLNWHEIMCCVFMGYAAKTKRLLIYAFLYWLSWCWKRKKGDGLLLQNSSGERI